MIRLAPRARTIVLPVMFGMGVTTASLSLIGIAGVLVLKSSDPSQWLRAVGGTTYAIIALTFVTAANFGTAVAGLYASAIGLRNFPSLDRRPWGNLLLLTIAPVALVGVLIPELFFAKFGSFLGLIGVAFAPLCGIQVADYYGLRRRRIDIRAIYVATPASPYWFWHGVNPAAMIALASGCAVYVLLLDPLSFVASAPFRYLTASLPAAVAAAFVHLGLGRLVGRSGRGGYRVAQGRA